MTTRSALLIAIVVAFLIATSVGPGTVEAQDDAKAARAQESVIAANQAFYAALNAMFEGDVAPMERVWSHAADATYFPPTGEMFTGWATIGESWRAQAALKLGGEVHTEDVKVVVGSNLAVVSSREVGNNPNTPSGAMKVDIRATKVFRLEGGAWKLVHHHTDVLPQLAQALD